MSYGKINTILYYTDLPTFYEIKAPFGKKLGKNLCLENIAIFYLPVTQKEPVFSISRSPNSTEIKKLVI